MLVVPTIEVISPWYSPRRTGWGTSGDQTTQGAGHADLSGLYRRTASPGGADGQAWFSVCQIEFALADPIEVGLCAIGKIDRAVYPGPFPAGTAIRFEGV